MIMLSLILFLATLISYWRFISNKKNVTDSAETSDSAEIINYFFENNVDIMQHLGYYNININSTKLDFIMECIKYLLYSSNPNFNEMFSFSWLSFGLDDDFTGELERNFINYCVTNNKSKNDFTINELTSFIKKQNSYKKLETRLNYTLSRAIILSKYLNENETDVLVDALTAEEKKMLIA